MFLRDGAFHPFGAIANCQLNFSLSSPNPASYLKVMSSDLAGAEENVPNS